MPPSLADQLRAAADTLDVLQRQREDLDRQRIALDARYRETQELIQRLAVMVAAGTLPAEVHPPVDPTEGDPTGPRWPNPDETRYEVALRVVQAHPDVHYSAYVADVYGEDTPKNRERLRAVLSDLGKRGQIRSLGNGKWSLGPAPRRYPPVAPNGSWTAQALDLLRQHPEGLNARGIKALYPDDKKRAQALYNGAYQLVSQGLVETRDGPEGMVFTARPEVPAPGLDVTEVDAPRGPDFPYARLRRLPFLSGPRGGGGTV